MSIRIKNILSYLFLLIILLSGNSVLSQIKLPDKPLINFVTIDTSSGKLQIDWKACKSPNIRSYKIYTLDISTYPVTGTYLDSVPTGTLTYSYSPEPGNSKIYTITAVDQSGNESLLSGDFHKPVRLNVRYDSCNNSMILEWEKYYGWKNNLTGYRIYAEKIEDSCNDDKKGLYDRNSEFILVQNIIDTNKIEFTLENIIENKDYAFYIEAYNNRGVSSTSNVRKKFTYMPAPPSYINLDYVTVLDDKTVEIAFSADLSGTMNDFQVSRGRSSEGNYTPLTILQDVIEPTITFTDNIVTQGEQYFYKIEALNSCFAPVASSNPGNNILLQGDADGSYIRLKWNPYLEFGTGTSEYRVFRKNQYSEYEFIASVSPDNYSFAEDISLSGNNKIKGEVEYFVEALEYGTNSLGVSGVSRSNEIKVNIETRIYMPNAFSPNDDTQNDFFTPIFDFIPKNYKMFIYDRSGKMLFHSTDANIGWDGSLNGVGKAPEAVYVYHVEFLSYNGVRQVRTGNVTLIYP